MLTKTMNFSDCQVKLEADARRFSGYASTFGGVDSYGDTIAPGAFAGTLKHNGMPKMFFNHDADSIPIGKWLSAKEDARGLLVEGEFTLGNAQGEAVYAAMKHGTIDGLSIGFYMKKTDFDMLPEGGRLIKSISRLVEISAVTFPADHAARIEAVKSINDPQEFERALRDAGCSREEAKTFVSRAKDLFSLRDADRMDEAKQVSEELTAAFLLRASTLRLPT